MQLASTYSNLSNFSVGTNQIVHFEPDVVSYTDYNPFGMFSDACFSSNEKHSRTNPDVWLDSEWGKSGQMPGRNNDGKYRYGFQGQEVDGEVKGEGNSVNYKYRMHCSSRLYGNPRMGRFFAVDPLVASYPHNSPYAFSENRTNDKIELEGLEAAPPHGNVDPWTTGLTFQFGVNYSFGNCFSGFADVGLRYQQMQSSHTGSSVGLNYQYGGKDNHTVGGSFILQRDQALGHGFTNPTAIHYLGEAMNAVHVNPFGVSTDFGIMADFDISNSMESSYFLHASYRVQNGIRGFANADSETFSGLFIGDYTSINIGGSLHPNLNTGDRSLAASYTFNKGMQNILSFGFSAGGIEALHNAINPTTSYLNNFGELGVFFNFGGQVDFENGGEVDLQINFRGYQF